MFVKRQLNLSVPDGVIAGPLLKAKVLRLSFDAAQLKENAREEAAAMIEQAHAQAEKIQEQARQQAEDIALLARKDTEQQIWQAANELLEALRLEQERMWEDIGQSAEMALRHTTRSLLDTYDEDERLRVVIKQVIQAQKQPVQGVLHCAPSCQAVIDNKLTELGNLHWKTAPDPVLQGDEMILETDSGRFFCSWRHISDELLCDAAL
ncbi:type III secretion system stator protein SctL [Vibrio quintilis]|uniref:V-type proton ATPase subunit E n=1 Tax=Vibrio quintilis TaxID=1117707 RepID=A0A1M7YW31_9VIBR|nr:type III secretion system stator protein SctL [Vibrio quintilis]SHO56773.1 V-type proton ATPase subunit E [Vibrio quintilis]